MWRSKSSQHHWRRQSLHKRDGTNVSYWNTIIHNRSHLVWIFWYSTLLWLECFSRLRSHTVLSPRTAHKCWTSRLKNQMWSSQVVFERGTLRKIRLPFQPVRSPPHHAPSEFREFVCSMPYARRDFANVILYVAYRQQGLVGTLFRIDTCSAAGVWSQEFMETEDGHPKTYLIANLMGPNAGLPRVPELNPYATCVTR